MYLVNTNLGRPPVRRVAYRRRGMGDNIVWDCVTSPIDCLQNMATGKPTQDQVNAAINSGANALEACNPKSTWYNPQLCEANRAAAFRVGNAVVQQSGGTADMSVLNPLGASSMWPWVIGGVALFAVILILR